MSNHNTDFCGEIRKDINTFWLKKCQVWSYETHLSILWALGKTRFWRKHLPVMFFVLNMAPDFFFPWVLQPFQKYFTHIEPVVHQRWAKTEEPGEKPPDHL